MSDELRGRRVAFLTANEGVEQVELTEPWKAVGEAGGTPELIAPKPGRVQGFNHLDKADTFPVDHTFDEVDLRDYDAIVLPGGVANPDQLRTHRPAVEQIRRYDTDGRIIAAICHAPWTLVEAGVVRGRVLTSWPSLTTDIRNAGGQWVDEELQVDGNLITSRKPDDLPAFCRALVERVAKSPRVGAGTA
jgi:protease I